MAEDFFGELGKKITKATHSAFDATSSLVESTKLSAQISGEQKEIDRIYRKLGESLLKKAEEGLIALDDEDRGFADEIGTHREKIAEIRKSLAAVKGMKVCPSCDELIEKDVAFCPKCGAATPVPEEAAEEVVEEVTGEAVEEATEEAVEHVQAAAEELAEDVQEVAEAAAEAVAEKAEDVADASFIPIEEGDKN